MIQLFFIFLLKQEPEHTLWCVVERYGSSLHEVKVLGSEKFQAQERDAAFSDLSSVWSGIGPMKSQYFLNRPTPQGQHHTIQVKHPTFQPFRVGGHPKSRAC